MSLDHWSRKARAQVGELNPGPMQEKASLKTLEAEIRRQTLACFMHVEKDLDMLHEQLHQDLYHAISKEFVSVAQNLNAIRREASEGVEELRHAGSELEKQVVALDYSIQYLQNGERDNATNASSAEVQKMVERAQEAYCKSAEREVEFSTRLSEVQNEVAAKWSLVQNEVARLSESIEQDKAKTQQEKTGNDFDSQLAQLQDTCFTRLSKLETQCFEEIPALHNKSVSLEDSFVKMAVQVKAAHDLSSRISEVEAQLQTMPLEHEQAAKSSASVDDAQLEDLYSRISQVRTQLQNQLMVLEAETTERATRVTGSIQDLSSRLSQLDSHLQSQALALESEAAERATRAGELAASVDVCRNEGLERHGQLQEVILKLANERPSARSASEDAVLDTGKVEELIERVEALGQDVEASRRDFDFSHACWMRNIDWTANVDFSMLESTGKYDVASPVFTAAGLRDLRLSLRIRADKSQQRRWTLGAFVRAAEGQVSFRLHVGDKVQSFAADFANLPEWGSQKIATLDRLMPRVPVRLEILDVVVAVPQFVSHDMVATFCMTDAARVAAREAEAVRSSMVKKVEWRVGRVSERIAAARAAASTVGDREALEPVMSPMFSAGGLEDLQLHLYPLGFLRRDERMPTSTFEEKCSFFLVCPKGTYVKCRAFVGDQVKIFEHTYEAREPFGRGNFCRLMDKSGNDDCVICGIEILEVRQERFTQVKASPFGNIVDQMKVTLAPGFGNMELMKELRNMDGPGGAKSQKSVHAPLAANILSPMGPSKRLANASSLPALLSVGSSSGQDASWTSPSNRSNKRIDAARK